ncbi:MAG: RHS repeat-associated core domain-containing protein [Lysobacterales bacterium]
MNLSRLLIVVCLLSAGVAHGQFVDPYEHYGDRIDSAKNVSMLGADAFGDQISLHNGALSFQVTDVELPGNSALPVRFTRRFEVHNSRAESRVHPLSDWSIDTPRISGRFPTELGWVAGTSTARCSNDAVPNIPDTGPGDVEPFVLSDFWQGVQLYIPGVASSEILKPVAGLPYLDPSHRWTTQDGQTRIRCLSSIQNGQAGEGFEALTPDGTLYRFDWMVQRPAVGLTKIGYQLAGPSAFPLRRNLSITEYALHATRVQDRFRNWVEYTYDPANPQRLTQIEGAQADGSDQRLITLHYNASTGLLERVSANGRDWRYHYAVDDGNRPTLRRVVLPDEKEWLIEFGDLAYTPITPQTGNITRGCYFEEPAQNESEQPSGSITHPSGAKATYVVAMQEHFRSNVTLTCENVVIVGGQNDPVDDYPIYPLSSRSWSLIRKEMRLSALQAPSKVWNYSYDYGEWATFHLYPVGNHPGTPPDINFPVCSYRVFDPVSGLWVLRCPFPAITEEGQGAGRSLTTVTQPDGSIQVHEFGTSWQYDEGKLLSIEKQDSTGEVLERVEYTYDLSRAPGTTGHPVQNYSVRFGTSRRDRADGFDAEHHRPKVSTEITRDQATFTWLVSTIGSAFELDALARTTSAHHVSSLGFSRPEQLTYADSTTPWVLSQLATKTINGAEAVRVTYDPATAMPLQYRAYEVLKETRTYRADGTLETTKDAKNQITTYLDWYRSTPREVRYHDNSRIEAELDANGWITSTTDERDRITGYDYDEMGRLELITPPDNPDGPAWDPTSLEFIRNPAPAYGLDANAHWRQRLTKGTYRQDTYFDNFWRPVVVHEYGTVGADPPRLRVTRHDPLDRPAFVSYPLASLSDYLSTELKGTTTTYDALGRERSRLQSSELGPLLTDFEWQPGFRLRVTDPKNHVTTTDFQAWSEPTTDFPVRVASPEGQTTEWTRDVYGKPLRIARSTLVDGQLTTRERHFGYDGLQRLCQRLEPETGLHIYAYDAADNLDWSAHGLNPSTINFGQIFANGFEDGQLPAPGVVDCGRATVSAAERITRGYDTRNRLLSIDYPDATADIQHTYHADGTLWTASRNGSVWTYQYNSLGLLKSEKLEYLAQTREFLHGYNTRGQPSSLTWPDASLLGYEPNVFGEPTRVGNYAQAIGYHPDGGLAQATYGTGIAHTRTPNDRFLPQRLLYTAGPSTLVDYQYVYDENANVESIDDARPAAVDTDDQTFGYDGLDRLTSASAPERYGNASYTYDAFDDLRSMVIGTRNWTYRYEDGSGRLTRITNPGGGAEWTFLYEPNGNRGNASTVASPDGTQNLAFDRADTLTQIVGQESYKYDAHGHRIEVVVAGQTRYPVHTRDGLLRIEYGPVTERYIHLGTQLIARETAGSARYLLVDHLGSPVAETNAAGGDIERSFHAPFGERWGTTAPAAPERGPGYTGHFEDGNKLTYMKARYESPRIGRMLSPDPVGPDQTSGANFNRYWYANNNPVKYVDPDGEWAQVAWSAARFAIQQCGRSPQCRGYAAKAAGATIGIASARAISEIRGAQWNLWTMGTIAHMSTSNSTPPIAVPEGQSASPNGPDDPRLQDPLTRAQRTDVNKIRNVEKNHAKPHDFEGVSKELGGVQIPRPGGGHYNHVKEMQNSVRALEEALPGIRGSLRNPNLSSAARAELESAYADGQQLLNRMRSALSGQ